MRSSRDSRAESVAGSRHRRHVPRALLAITMLIVVAAMLFAVAAPALAIGPTAYTIDGTVRDVTAVPISGIIVTLYNAAGVGILTDTTDAGGLYSLLTPAVGTYRVGFADPAGAYVSQWWDNKATLALATAIPLGTTGTITYATGVSNIDATLVESPANVITVGAVSGSYAPNAAMTVSWTTSQAVSTGTFAIFARTSAGAFVPATATKSPGGTSASSWTQAITVPAAAGTGYKIVVAWGVSATAFGPFSLFGTAPGTFTVTGATDFEMTITDPSGSGDVYTNAAADPVPVAWTCNMAPVNFSSSATQGFTLWVRSASGSSWFGPVFVDSAAAHLGYTDITQVDPHALRIPVGTGYQVIVHYLDPGTADIDAWATSPGSFDVTDGSTDNTIAVTGGSGSYTTAGSVLVNWTFSRLPSAATACGVFARSTGGTWYYLGTQITSLTIFSYTGTYSLATGAVPIGTYQIVVGWGPSSVSGLGPFTIYGTQSGTFTVVAAKRAPSAH